MQSSISKSLFLLFVLNLLSTPVHAVSEAGELRKKDTDKPKPTVYIANNITDVNLVNSADNGKTEPIDFSAVEIISDDETGVITALGNVEILYNGMRLTTDKLVYNRNDDTISAIENVVLYASDGSVVNGDFVKLTDDMTSGIMQDIKILLRDKSHVAAKRFNKKSNQTKTLHDAEYTACDFCENKSPLWKIKARKVQHDEKSQDVNYNDAWIYFKQVPIFYTPFLTHPDPSVKRRSGLLPPRIGSSSFLGGYFQAKYFWAVNDQTNIILSPIFSADKDIVWGGEYEQYFYKGHIRTEGTYLKDKKNETKLQQHRGNIFATGRYDINDLWRMTFDGKYVSDYIYLKEMGLPYNNDAWLTSDLKFERFSGRDYISVEAYHYKLLSYNLHRSNIRQYRRLNDRKPAVAPLIEAEFYTEPDSIGSYFKNNLSSASVYHPNGMQTQRITSINSWELPYTSAFGEKYRFVASLKSDGYYVNRYQHSDTDTFTGTTGRIFPQAGVEWRLPFVRATDTSRHIIEPTIVTVLAPNGGNKIDKIPNEDSEDVYFDDTNVLDLNRYAGYDRNDTGSRISYGINWSSYGNFMGHTSAFIAQSYEFSRKSEFMENLDSKENGHSSDIVGRINAQPNSYLNLDYRFRLDKKTFDAKYNELGVIAGPTMLKLNVSYIFLQGNTHYNNIYSQRKQLYTSLSIALTRNWNVRFYDLKDLTPAYRGSLEHGGSLTYEDECFKWDITAKKYNNSNPNIDNDYEFGITFYLKTLGGFGS